MNDSRPAPKLAHTFVYLITSYVLFYGIQFSVHKAIPWIHHPWRQILSAGFVTLIAAFVLPHLQRILHKSNRDKEESTFRTAAENSLDDIYLFSGIPDASGKIVDFRFSYINPTAERRLRAHRETLLGRALSEVRPFAVSSGLIERYQEVVRTGVPYTAEVFVDDERIHSTWLHVHAVKIGDGIAITSRDFTERKHAIDQASFLANHDQLTGLANRSLLQARLDAAILQAKSDQSKVAVFMIDLDNFKQINDSHGHAIGDKVLNIVAKRLLGSVRETDTVARLGGDEFVIVIPKFKDLTDVERCGQKILRAVDRPITLDGTKIHITVSAGFSIYPDSGMEASDLLKNADAAMYSVKSMGRNGIRLFRQSSESAEMQQLA